PEDRERPTEPQSAASLERAGSGSGSDDVERARAREVVERRGLRAHRGREDPRDEVRREKRRQIPHEKRREDLVGRGKRTGPAPEEGEEKDADRREERHRGEDEKAAADERPPRVPEAPAREEPLDDQLV